MKKYYSDLHCHPSLKPFSVSDHGENSENINDKRSIWNTDTNFDVKIEKLIESIIPVAKYKQSDFQKAFHKTDDGNVRLIFLSITPPEIDYFKIKFISDIQGLEKTLGVLIPDFITELGTRRISRIKGLSGKDH
jgi:hypothetical protein